MTLYINGSKQIGPLPGNAGEYLKTNDSSGVFIDIAPYGFGTPQDSHCGVAFFCAGVPAGAPDNVAWTGEARGITFYKDHTICWEDWLGNGLENHNTIPGAYWQDGVTYRITGTYTATGVALGVYKTDSAGNVVALVASETRSHPSTGKGTDACVFATPGTTVGCSPNALFA